MGKIIDFRKKNLDKKLSLYANIDYSISNNCKNDNRYGSTCLKCGKCGRKFNENGVLK